MYPAGVAPAGGTSLRAPAAGPSNCKASPSHPLQLIATRTWLEEKFVKRGDQPLDVL
jgi:hypothetical protein